MPQHVALCLVQRERERERLTNCQGPDPQDLVLFVPFVPPMTKITAPAAARTIFQASIPKKVAPLALTASAAATTIPASAFCMRHQHLTVPRRREGTHSRVSPHLPIP